MRLSTFLAIATAIQAGVVIATVNEDGRHQQDQQGHVGQSFGRIGVPQQNQQQGAHHHPGAAWGSGFGAAGGTGSSDAHTGNYEGNNGALGVGTAGSGDNWTGAGAGATTKSDVIDKSTTKNKVQRRLLSGGSMAGIGQSGAGGAPSGAGAQQAGMAQGGRGGSGGGTGSSPGGGSASYGSGFPGAGSSGSGGQGQGSSPFGLGLGAGYGAGAGSGTGSGGPSAGGPGSQGATPMLGSPPQSFSGKKDKKKGSSASGSGYPEGPGAPGGSNSFGEPPQKQHNKEKSELVGDTYEGGVVHHHRVGEEHAEKRGIIGMCNGSGGLQARFIGMCNDKLQSPSSHDSNDRTSNAAASPGDIDIDSFGGATAVTTTVYATAMPTGTHHRQHHHDHHGDDLTDVDDHHHHHHHEHDHHHHEHHDGDSDLIIDDPWEILDPALESTSSHRHGHSSTTSLASSTSYFMLAMPSSSSTAAANVARDASEVNTNGPLLPSNTEAALLVASSVAAQYPANTGHAHHYEHAAMVTVNETVTDTAIHTVYVATVKGVAPAKSTSAPTAVKSAMKPRDTPGEQEKKAAAQLEAQEAANAAAIRAQHSHDTAPMRPLPGFVAQNEKTDSQNGAAREGLFRPNQKEDHSEDKAGLFRPAEMHEKHKKHEADREEKKMVKRLGGNFGQEKYLPKVMAKEDGKGNSGSLQDHWTKVSSSEDKHGGSPKATVNGVHVAANQSDKFGKPVNGPGRRQSAQGGQTQKTATQTQSLDKLPGRQALHRVEHNYPDFSGTFGSSGNGNDNGNGNANGQGGNGESESAQNEAASASGEGWRRRWSLKGEEAKWNNVDVEPAAGFDKKGRPFASINEKHTDSQDKAAAAEAKANAKTKEHEGHVRRFDLDDLPPKYRPHFGEKNGHAYAKIGNDGTSSSSLDENGNGHASAEVHGQHVHADTPQEG